MSLSLDYLDFEYPIAEIDLQIQELEHLASDGEGENAQQINQLKKKRDKLITSIYSDLSAWQVVQTARHPKRPYTLDYIRQLLSDFEELHGDRQYADDQSIITGIGHLGERAVAIVGHQKGRDTEENIKRNFGMPRPEAYRKASRVFALAERFNMPILTLIDTPGAYPGIDAEERNQSAAIAENLRQMSTLKVPIISVIIGEGGSGGALAIAVCDYLMMLQHSIYSVISPEGCASILWKDAQKAQQAAELLSVTSKKLQKLGLIDEVIPEPNGGAHRDFDSICLDLRAALERQLKRLEKLSPETLTEERYQKLMAVGRFQDG